ncbi:MAG: hypothetical protein AAGC68_00970 [Verrucomicrobiota bacterium]
MKPLLLFLSVSLIGSVYANEKPDTQFLVPGELIFSEAFSEPSTYEKPTWYLRKSDWVVEDGALRGINDGGNGPFIRLQSQENGGPLPEDYIMTFSFKIEENPTEKKSNKHHETRSSGHRFSLGHYAAKIQWRPDTGIDLNIGHGDAFEDDRFFVERGQWYHVTIEIQGDQLFVSFEDGPAYFLQHDHFRHKPSGWEFFTHVSEVGYLKNLRVYGLTGEVHPSWPKTLETVIEEKRAFFSAENPDFQITKDKSK